MHDVNRPALYLRVVVVDRKHDGSAVCRLQVANREFNHVTLKHWEWRTGRPNAEELSDLSATVVKELEATIIASRGVQGTL